MQESVEDAAKSKRQIKRIVIIFAIVEFIVTVFVMYYATNK
jgi:hypothetical protein